MRAKFVSQIFPSMNPFLNSLILFSGSKNFCSKGRRKIKRGPNPAARPRC